MIRIVSPAEIQLRALELRRQGLKIGFVPTMGALHEGHMSLVKIARGLSDVVVVSVFVNPIQFGPSEDYARYPRDIERDSAMCEAAGVDVFFAPEARDMYLPDSSVYVVEERLSAGLCGAFRPGHFRGVLTVVAKLFNMTQPHLAVFGQKDAQQARIVKRMVRDLNFPIQIVVAPTYREADGLAMSSRNAYLSPSERRAAPGLYAALKETEKAFLGGERNARVLRDIAIGKLARTPEFRVEYLEIVDDETLERVETVSRPALVAAAVHLGRTRLIDNIVLSP